MAEASIGLDTDINDTLSSFTEIQPTLADNIRELHGDGDDGITAVTAVVPR